MHRRHLVILALAGAALAACAQPSTTAVTKTNDSSQGASCPTSHADGGVPVDCSPERANPTTPLGGPETHVEL